MKRKSYNRILRTLTTLCLAFAALSASAETVTVTVDDIKYTIDTTTGEAKVASQASSLKKENLVIPESISYNGQGYPVTSIGNNAFWGCSGLTGSLTIPNSVTTIGSDAFFCCSGLTGDLTIGNSVTNIGDYAFLNCSGLTGSLTIPDAVTSIGKYAFYGCSGLTGSLTIPDAVTSIGNSAFYDCSGLTGSLTIPNSLTSIGEHTFVNCSGLGSLIIPNSVTTIADCAFSGCSGLTKVTLPTTLQTIGGQAFYGCKNLTSVICEATTPPVNKKTGSSTIIDSSSFGYPAIGSEGTLSVPTESIQLYKEAFGWKEFKNIQGITPDPTSISLNNSTGTINVGQTLTLIANIQPDDANKTVIWSSSNEEVATVIDTGVVTGVSPGSATITATTTNGLTATCTVTVSQPAESIELEGIEGDLTLKVGETNSLNVKFTPENTSDKSLTFESSNPDVVTIDENGEITAVGPGSATVTVTTANGKTVELTVNVEQPAGSIAIDLEAMGIGADGLSLNVGESKTLEVKFTPENTTDKSLTFETSDEAIATVDADGKVTALAPGVAVITITAANGVSATINVTVIQHAEAIEIDYDILGITIEGLSLKVGESKPLAVKFTPDNVTETSLTFESSDPAIATVDETGSVTGIAPGTAEITITAASGVRATVKVTVTSRETTPVVVTRSDEEVILMDGMEVRLWIEATGGNPDGFSYEWSHEGVTVGTTNELSVTGHSDGMEVSEAIYSVKVVNTMDGVEIFNETYAFAVITYPKPQETTRTEVSTIKIREGNTLTITADEPEGGYNAWSYEWSRNGETLSTEREFTQKMTLSASGTEQATEEVKFDLTATNCGPDGETWGDAHGATESVRVYRRPQTPAQLLKKGNGASHTLVIMAGLTDSELDHLGYTFVYGCTDAEGADHVLATTPLRYCQIDREIFDSSDARKWCYAVWTYEDGSTVSSGKRYLDGTVDEDFDASAFNNSTEPAATNGKEPSFTIRKTAGAVLVTAHAPSTTRIDVYDLNGSKIISRQIEAATYGDCRIDATDVVPGLYMLRVENEQDHATRKIVIKDF